MSSWGNIILHLVWDRKNKDPYYNKDTALLQYDASKKVNNSDKTVEIIIGSGFGRTGTASLRAGLNELGYKCYHMVETMNKENAVHAKLWIYLYKEKIKLQQEKKVTSFHDWNLITLDMDKYGKYFDEIFDKNGYTASVDWPSCMFYLELIEYYQRKGINYKIILSVRDSAEQWFKSYSSTIGRAPVILNTWIWRLIPGIYERRNLSKIIFDLPFGASTITDKEHVMNQYNLWIESVQKFVAKDKLLIYNVKQGWKPLCNFLELEIPSKYADKPDEFIRSNDTKQVKKAMAAMERVSMIANVVVGVVVTGFVGYFSWKLGTMKVKLNKK